MTCWYGVQCWVGCPGYHGCRKRWTTKGIRAPPTTRAKGPGSSWHGSNLGSLGVIPLGCPGPPLEWTCPIRWSFIGEDRQSRQTTEGQPHPSSLIFEWCTSDGQMLIRLSAKYPLWSERSCRPFIFSFPLHTRQIQISTRVSNFLASMITSHLRYNITGKEL